MIQTSPPQELGIFVVVPCYNEQTIEALLRSLEACLAPPCQVEVLVLINEHTNTPSGVKETNQCLYDKLQSRPQSKTPTWLNIHLCHLRDLPVKHAGVGLARKLAMDEGYSRFEWIDRDGIIVNIDADCTCEPNYFQAIYAHFLLNPKSWAAGIHFEHALNRPEIIAYELHLRYFIQAQRFAGLPFSYQTLGSCMVVRSKAYARMGGMNKRKAAEDFYFLQKFIEIGRFSEIHDTTVFPSSRTSERVPFGTGKAIRDILSGQPQTTYSIRSILALSVMLESLQDLYQGEFQPWIRKLDGPVASYLQVVGGEERIQQIRQHTASFESFRQKFLQWFNAFRVMKYLHHARQKYPDQPVFTEACKFYGIVLGKEFEGVDTDLLAWFRNRALGHIDTTLA